MKAGRIVSETLQVLAVLVTASPVWAAYMGDRAMLVPLTRVLVYRSRIAEIAASTSSNDHDHDNPFDDASNKADGCGPEGKASMPTEQDVLCLVLALLTTGAVQSDAVVYAIHNTRELAKRDVDYDVSRDRADQNRDVTNVHERQRVL